MVAVNITTSTEQQNLALTFAEKHGVEAIATPTADGSVTTMHIDADLIKQIHEPSGIDAYEGSTPLVKISGEFGAHVHASTTHKEGYYDQRREIAWVEGKNVESIRVSSLADEGESPMVQYSQDDAGDINLVLTNG